MVSDEVIKAGIRELLNAQTTDLMVLTFGVSIVLALSLVAIWKAAERRKDP